MVGYLGLLVLFSSLYFKDLKMFAGGLLIVILYTSLDLLWTYARDRVWYLPVSSWISGFVLTIGALPKPPLVILIALPFLAVASKQLLHFGKNRHVFNPAAFALAAMSFVAPSVSWWAVAGELLPTISGLQKLDPGMWLFLFSCVGAVIILWRQSRWHVTVPFLLSYAFFLSAFSLSNGIDIGRLPHVLFAQIVSGVILFFSTVMVIEPMTSTFKTKRQEMFYGGLVGLAVVVITYLARKFNLVSLDPLVFGLLSGNLIASLLFLPVRKPSSYWFKNVSDRRRFPSLRGNKNVDVVIIGGGMAGVSTAYFLAKAGIKTALLEMGNIATGDSGYSTVMATHFLDSAEATTKAYDASEAGIRLLEKTIQEEKINCDWKMVDGVCFSKDLDLAEFEKTVKILQTKDSAIEYLDKNEAIKAVGVSVEAAYRKKGSEGQFHIRKFLLGLAKRAVKNGALFFEDSEAIDIQLGSSVVVKTVKGTITANWLVVATGMTSAKFFPEVSKNLSAAITYVINVKFANSKIFPRSLFWDNLDPYHYFRWAGNSELLFGGQDWRMKEPRPKVNPHTELENWLSNFCGQEEKFKIINKWQGSIFYTPDILPYIGSHSAYGNNAIFLTGWAGNGIAHGFLAGSIAADMVQKKNNQYQSIFDFNR